MLSYALGSLKIERNENKDSETGDASQKLFKGNGVFGFIKNREISVAKELEKYGQIRGTELLKRLTDVLTLNNFNVRMLVAADHWFRGNDKPRIFTPEMFTTNNIHFLEMSAISYGNKKVWDRDALTTLLTYAKYLQTHVYPESQDIEVLMVDKTDEDFEQFGFGDYGNEEEYD